MTNSYFRNIPDFEYVNRIDDGKSDGDYVKLKNFFKKGKLRDDIFQDLTFFTKYVVEGRIDQTMWQIKFMEIQT